MSYLMEFRGKLSTSRPTLWLRNRKIGSAVTIPRQIPFTTTTYANTTSRHITGLCLVFFAAFLDSFMIGFTEFHDKLKLSASLAQLHTSCL